MSLFSSSSIVVKMKDQLMEKVKKNSEHPRTQERKNREQRRIKKK
jgi:hypothetical protein